MPTFAVVSFFSSAKAARLSTLKVEEAGEPVASGPAEVGDGDEVVGSADDGADGDDDDVDEGVCDLATPGVGEVSEVILNAGRLGARHGAAIVLQTFRRLREQTHAFLDKVGEDGLDQPTKCQPPGFGGYETVGSAIQIIACHAIGHMGGLTVVRAASGKQRSFIPSEELRAF
jgi:hypothetical protein